MILILTIKKTDCYILQKDADYYLEILQILRVSVICHFEQFLSPIGVYILQKYANYYWEIF